MGTDIHPKVEGRIDGKWVALDVELCDCRDYAAFDGRARCWLIDWRRNDSPSLGPNHQRPRPHGHGAGRERLLVQAEMTTPGPEPTARLHALPRKGFVPTNGQPGRDRIGAGARATWLWCTPIG